MKMNECEYDNTPVSEKTVRIMNYIKEKTNTVHGMDFIIGIDKIVKDGVESKLLKDSFNIIKKELKKIEEQIIFNG